MMKKIGRTPHHDVFRSVIEALELSQIFHGLHSLRFSPSKDFQYLEIEPNPAHRYLSTYEVRQVRVSQCFALLIQISYSSIEPRPQFEDE